MTVAQRSLKLNLTHTNILTKETFERGEIFLDQELYTLRLMNASTPGGVALLRADLGNLSATSITLPGTIQGTTITATTGFTGNLTGNVTGNVSGSAGTVTSIATNTLTSSQVTTALTYTPYNSTNPSGYITTGSLSVTTAAAGVQGLTYSAGAFTFTPALNITGNAATATKLATSRNINGIAFDGSQDITLPAVNAGNLSGTALNATITGSSLTSVGTLSSLTVTGLITANGGLTGAHNGTVGASTPNTGAFTTITSSSITDATSVGVGAVVLQGGLSVAKQVRAAGDVVISSTTAATTDTDGALRVAGGASVVGDLRVRGTIYGTIQGSVSVSAIDNTPIGQSTPNPGSFTTLSSNSTTTINGTVTGTGINRYVTSKALAFAAAMS
jgi:hypothetical protein